MAQQEKLFQIPRVKLGSQGLELHQNNDCNCNCAFCFLKPRRGKCIIKCVPQCTELGIGIVPYSPLGRGFFGGRAVVESVPANSFLTNYPRFQGENLDRNKNLYLQMEKLAQYHGCTPAQLILGWVLHQGNDVAPIPGTTKIKNLDSNIDSLTMKLTEEDLKEITDVVPINGVAGPRTLDSFFQVSWKFANTTPKEKQDFKLK